MSRDATIPSLVEDSPTDRAVTPLPKEPISEPVPDAPAAPAQDLVLFTVVLALVAFGLVMVYSASAFYATQKFGSATYFFKRDLVWTALGLGVMWFAARTDYGVYKRWSYPMLGAAIALLAAVLVVGARINGARRWFHFAGVSFQPAELAKLALMVYLACSLAKKAEKVKSFTVGFVPHMLVCGLMMGLLLKQPDLGTAVILGLATLMLLFVAGAKISYILIAVLAAAPIVWQSIVGTPWRAIRMFAFLHPENYRYGVGYQITESLISVGSGGLTGLGLGDGRQKLFFLPEAHTDYIVAIIGEELGLLGLGAIALLFAILIWRGARAALKARDAFGSYLGFGITAMFGLQAAVNIGVVLGVLPTKGLPLPFVSFGGSTLVVDLFAIGVLLNISRAGPEPVAGVKSAWPKLSLFSRRGNRRKPGGGRRVTVEAV
jgi:cell division protein FtsW